MTNTSHPPQLRVLVADDNPDMRKTVAHLLEEEFDVVGIVADGRSLVEAASRLKPNIGIVDISMPLMSGIEAAKEIKRSGLEMKIVFLTVNEDPDFVRAALEAGGSGYVIKRKMLTDLVQAVKETGAGRTFVSACCQVLRDDGTIVN